MSLPGAEYRIDVLWRDSRCRPQNQKMIKGVGAFRGQMRLIALHCRECGFYRFFAEFLGAFLHPLRQELGGVGSRGIARGLAGRNGGEKPVDGVNVAHESGISTGWRAGASQQRPAARIKHSAIAGWQNGPMSREPISPGRIPPRALAVAGGVALGYLVFLGAMLAEHRWVVGPSGHPLATDFISFWSAGHLALTGQATAAYDWQTMHVLQGQLIGHEASGYFGWAYPPLFLPVAMLLSLIPYAASFLLWTGVTLALYALVVERIAGDRGAAVFACAVPATLACAMAGQNGFLSAVLIGCALVQLERRPLVAGLLIGLLTYKPHLGLLIPVALLFGGYWRGLLAALAATLVILLFSWLLAPASLMAFVDHMGPMRGNFLSGGVAGFYKQQSLYGLLRTLGTSDGSAFMVQGVLLLGLVGFVAWLWRSGHGFALKCAGLLAAGLLATPYLYLYDFPILSVTIAFVWRDRAFSRGELALILLSQFAITAFIFVKTPMGLFASLLVLIVVLRRAWLARIKTAPQLRTA